ncbi:hypothetical protein D3C78_1317010 [compost metagenome]
MPLTSAISINGLSWLGVELTSNLPSLFTVNQAHPEPKRVAPAAANFSLNASHDPNAASIAAANSPVGWPPAFGPITAQNKEWL